MKNAGIVSAVVVPLCGCGFIYKNNRFRNGAFQMINRFLVLAGISFCL